MSYFEDASLVYIPSAVKDAKTYSIKPTDGSGDLTFSRGSDIEATRVNANGYIEKAKVNLLYHSNNFTFTWTNTRTSEASGYAGYDGTNDAWALIGTAVDSTHLIVQNITLSAQVVTFSVYVKAGARDWCILRLDDGTPAYAYFDLSTGTKGTISGTYIDSTITSVGGGWYRLSVTRLATSGANVAVIYPAEADNDTTYLGDGVTEDLYIQDAQINYGLVVQDYVDSTGAAATIEGITDNMPRLNYDPANPTCPSLLLEPSRQNILANDTYIASTFAFDNCTASYNNSISPEGVQNALLLTQTGSTATNSIYNFSLPTTAGNYSYSFFLKAGTSSKCRLYTNDGVLGILEDFNPQTITAGKTGGDLDLNFEDYGNDWWRISFTRSIAAGATYHRLWFYPDRNNTNGNISIYGWQIELGSYPSSLIPTYGSSATRTADSAYKTGISSLIGQTEGTIFVDANLSDIVDPSNIRGILEVNDGTTANRISIYRGANDLSSNVIVFSGSAPSAAVNLNSATGRTKIAVSYNSSIVTMYVNGSLVGTSTPTYIPTCSDLDLGKITKRNDRILGDGINQALLFKTRLSNADLATLTSL